MKTVLIAVVSSDFPPYDRLMNTCQTTWDTIEVNGVDSIYYCGESRKPNTEKVIYIPTGNELMNMGMKTLMFLAWALENKEFDYMARTSVNTYVEKYRLLRHVQTLPDTDLFATLEVKSENPDESWGWGLGTILSRDVVKKTLDNRELWNHSQMEDMAWSRLIKKLGIPYYPATACSIDKLPDGGWQCMGYGLSGFTFNNFSEIGYANGQFLFRCKQDYDRSMDTYVMEQLLKHLKTGNEYDLFEAMYNAKTV